LGVAQTGTGKTAAFGIPILNHLLKENNSGQGKRKIKALVVTPTRELAIQIAENFTDYSQFTHLRNTVIFGGVKQSKQVASLQQGVDILVATPGRLLDLMNQGYITFRDLKYVVLDEADQMLDMGFIHDVKKIIAKLPPNRQSLFFSATMPKTIVELSQKMLGDFERVTIKPEQATAEKVKQGVYFVSKNNKPNLLIHLLEQRPQDSVLVFSRTKHGANKIVKTLDKAKIKSAAIHGNKSQAQRQKALGEFKDGSLKVLIATDIAARGIDVDDLALVINYDLPNVSETYVHRIGRTGRASASGIALSFCMGDERPYLKDIEKLIKQQVPRMGEHPYMEGADVVDGSLDKKPQGRNNNRNRPNNKNRNNNRNRNRN
jgi:ATP-dependent RNA helicase RhlE